jgi:hypothetical protein
MAIAVGLSAQPFSGWISPTASRLVRPPRPFAMVVVGWWYSVTKVTVFCTTIYILTDFSLVYW